jgi:hypothetical protein
VSAKESKSTKSAKKSTSTSAKRSADDSSGKGSSGVNSGDLSDSSAAFKALAKQMQGMDQELREEATEQHITLDRVWLLDDAEGIEVYKVLPRIFYYKPLFYLRRQLVALYPVQKVVAISAIMLHKHAAMLDWLAKNFDEKGATYASLKLKIHRSLENRDKWLLLSRSIVQMSYDFTLRRKVFAILVSVYRASTKTIKFLRGLLKSAGGGKPETPYEYWKRSLEKTDLVCIMDKGGGGITILGEFKMDLKAPVEIMRENIYRDFRDELNKIVGESFLFAKLDPDSGDEIVLKREEEFKTYAKDFCFKRTDAKTMITLMTAMIVSDPSRGRVIIPEFAAMTEEEREDEEKRKLLEDEEQEG